MSKPLSNASAAVVVALFGVGLVATAFGMGLYIAFVGGYVAAKIWLWHVVPHGFPAYPWTAFAAGLLLLRLCRSGFSLRKEEMHEEPGKIATAIVAPLLVPWATLLFAWWLT